MKLWGQGKPEDKVRWKAWADDCLERKAELEKEKKKWKFNKKGEPLNKGARNWEKKRKEWMAFASVDFSGHDFRKEKNSKFSEFVFPHDVNFSKAKFWMIADFVAATFHGEAFFFGATFRGKADFSKAKFTGEAHFHNARFNKMSDFSEAKFTRKADFSRVKFNYDALFPYGHFEGEADFSRAKFYKRANFHKREFNKKANFSYATFRWSVEFPSALFEEETDFSDATFKGEVDFTGRKEDFSGATFKKDAYFSGATFEKDVNFSGATFEGEALFPEYRQEKRVCDEGSLGETSFEYETKEKKVTFYGNANFSRATFTNEASFLNAIFHREAKFSGAIFVKNAIFSDFTFPKTADFPGVTFKGEANFSGAIFRGDANFSIAPPTDDEPEKKVTFERKVDFSGATFERKVDFSGAIFIENAIFSDFTFPKTADFSSVTFTRDAVFQSSEFVKAAVFNEAVFNGDALFTYAQSKGAFSMAGAEFKQVPDFIQMSFRAPVRMDNILIEQTRRGRDRGAKCWVRILRAFFKGNKAAKWRVWRLIRKKTAEFLVRTRRVFSKGNKEKAARWRALKKIATDGADHVREMNFFAGELLERRGSDYCMFGARWLFDFFYLLFSNYGRGIILPLIWWAGLVVLFAVVYWCSATDSDCGLLWWNALFLSLIKSLPLIGAGMGEQIREISLCLYCSDPLPPCISGITMLQTLLSTLFIFLILLGLRNNFRIK